MRLRFHGPLGVVTGSCYELIDETLEAHFLVDCGMKQGEPDADKWNAREFPFDPAELDFVVLTHAHLDHCGLIPLLYRRGFDGPVYCSKATAKLARIVLHDAVKHGAPYAQSDIDKISWRQHSGRLLCKSHKVGGDIRLAYLRSAHILGATSVEVSWGAVEERNRILFSGDIGNNTKGSEFQPLLRHGHRAYPPSGPKNYVVMEATYGGRTVSEEHKRFHTRIARLQRAVEKTTLHKEGTLVIPCFAINRTQDVLFDLHYLYATNPRLANVPVYFDAGMASRANRVYADELARCEPICRGDLRPTWLNERLFEWLDLDPDEFQTVVAMLRVMLRDDVARPEAFDTHDSWVVQQWKRIWKPALSGRQLPSHVGGPCIVVTGGGMCQGGPVVNYLEALLGDERHTVLLTGYCSPETFGGRLQELADLSPEEREMMSGHWSLSGGPSISLSEVRAQITSLSGYSGHADHNGLIDWFFSEFHGERRPAGWTTFLTHATDRARRALRKGLLEAARRHAAYSEWSEAQLEVELPDDTERWFDLDAGKWLAAQEPSAAELLALEKRLDALPASTKQKLAAVLQS